MFISKGKKMEKRESTKKELRTDTQNRAFHLWCEQIADALNDAGYEKKLTIGTIDVPWSKETVKIIIKKIAHAQINKWKTSEMTREEFSKVQETTNRMLSELGIYVPFPSIEALEEELKRK